MREIYHFGDKFLNGYSHQKMQVVRGYFDQVFEGSYSKRLPADKHGAIEAGADQKYTAETGQQKVDRNSPLWKTLRNVETSDRFPDLWEQFRNDLNNGGVTKTVKGQTLTPLGGFGEGASIPPELLKPETFPVGKDKLPLLGGFGEGSSIPPELLKPEDRKSVV